MNKKKAASDLSLPVLPNEKQWTEYFTREFSPPDPFLEDSFSAQLDEALCGNSRDPGSTLTASNIRDCIKKGKKKESRGIDELCGLNLLYGTEFLVHHLELLYQMIFNCGVVSYTLCADFITPVPKKGKNKSSCSSYRPITVATFVKVI